MTIQTTRWSPDTCDCVIEYTWDDAVASGSRTHTVSNVISRCSAHTALADNTTVFNTLMDENPRKNSTLQTAIDNLATQLSETGAAGGTLKNGITYNFSYTGTAPNRTLTVSFTGITLTTAQKNALQNALNTKFGAGKVTVS